MCFHVEKLSYMVHVANLSGCLFFFDASLCHACPAPWALALRLPLAYIRYFVVWLLYQMSVKEHIANFATPDRAILVALDSKQLSALGNLGDHDYLVQEERWLHERFNLTMGFSIQPASIKAIKDQKQAWLMFRGDPVRLLYVCLRKDFQVAQENVQALLKLLPDWKIVEFVILDNLNGELYEEGPKIANEVLINAEFVWNFLKDTAFKHG